MANEEEQTGLRASWRASAARALFAMGLILPVALVLNAVIGRTIHWDIAAIIAVLGFLGLTLAYRHAR